MVFTLSSMVSLFLVSFSGPSIYATLINGRTIGSMRKR